MKLLDSEQRESRTLFFVTVAFWAITIKYILAEFDLSTYGLGKQGSVTMGEYAGSFAAIIAVWLGREWVKQQPNARLDSGS